MFATIQQDIFKMSNIGIRKNIQRLNPGERKQYFWCLKMLGIIPANTQRAKRYYYSIATDTYGENRMTAKCIHDQLIANHATCCEHGSYYFQYYHRHLMVYFELMINYSHELLSNRQQFSKQYADMYYTHKEQFDIVFDEYQNISNKSSKVNAHYWNPTNYNNSQDLLIPIELANPADFPHSLDSMDRLYCAVKGENVYEVNVPKRWYNDASKYDCVTFATKNKSFLNQNNIQPTQQITKFMTGQLNPRNLNKMPFSDFYKIFDSYTTFPKDDEAGLKIPNGYNIQASRNYQKFKISDKMNVYNTRGNQIYPVYGGRQTNSQYIQLGLLNYIPTIKGLQVQYNERLPHYQLAHAIYNQNTLSFNKYLDSRATINNQTSHNKMHNMCFFIMLHDDFSLTNLMFFPYHSWIDIQLELRLRKDRLSQSANVYNHLDKPKDASNLFDYILYDENQVRTFGDYPIIQWANPDIKPKFFQIKESEEYKLAQTQQQRQSILFNGLEQFSENDVIYAFKAGQYVINKENNNLLRSSKQLTNIYKQYLTRYSKDFTYYQGFNSFEASYDIELFQTLYLPKNPVGQQFVNVYQILTDNSSNMPKYLEQMKYEVNLFNHLVQKNINAAKQQTKQTCSMKDLFSLVNRNMTVIGQYASKINNGTYTIEACFANLIKEFQNFDTQFFNPEQKLAFTQGFPITSLQIFGKGKDAVKCINCSQFKLFFLDFGEALFRRNSKLWKCLSSLLNSNKIYYDSSNIIPETHQTIISNLITLSVNIDPESFKNIRFLNGAGELSFHLESKDPKACLTIQLQVSDLVSTKILPLCPVQTCDESKIIHFQKITKLTKQDDKNTKNVDTRTYNRVKGTVKMGQLTKDFHFSIKNYHKLLNFNVIAEIIDANLEVRVEDRDYVFKKAFLKFEA